MTQATLAAIGPLAVVLGFAALGRIRPTWLVPAILALVPWQIRLFSDFEIATLALLGAIAARAPQMARAAAQRPFVTAALAGLPLWIATSVLWARQPAFVSATFGKWTLLVGAVLLAAADDADDPRPLVAGAIAAAVPASLWALAERLHLISPRGDPRALEAQLIRVGDLVRGRGLFHHPNKLAEFLEQVGLLLAGTGLGGVAAPLCLAAYAAAVAGVWGTGSMGGLGVVLAGLPLLAAALWLPRRMRWLWAGAAVVASALAWLAYVGHGGLGSRWIVYRFAADLIAREPWLGIGGGNWALAVGNAPPDVSRYWFRSHPHSLPLMLLAELGVVGLLLAIAFFAVPLWVAVQRLSDAPPQWRAVGIGAVAGVLGLLAHGLVNYFFRYPVNGIATGLLLGIALAAAGRGERR